MAVRLGVDFGASSTVLAVWDDSRGEAVPLELPDLSRPSDAGEDRTPIVPSTIHYASDGRQWIGRQVQTSELSESPHTFRLMKQSILRRADTARQIGDRRISPGEAARDFLRGVLARAGEIAGRLDGEGVEVAFTAPVEAYEFYEDWLLESARSAGIARPRLIDDASAAALGHGARVQPGEAELVFDFGAATLDVSIVGAEEPGVGGAPRRRVFGKAGADLGGATIDQWLFQDVLARSGAAVADEPVRQISRSLLLDCERCKEALSLRDVADVSVLNVYTGTILSGEYSRAQFEELLDRHGLFARIEQTIQRALDAARRRGCEEERIGSALLVGGSSLIPSIRSQLSQMFGAERVRVDRPFDAAARGAAAFAAGAEVQDHIQHDYAVRHLDPGRGGYGYRPVVRRGTTYPTHGPVAKMLLKATREGQHRLGIAIFEAGEPSPSATSEPAPGPFDLVFDAAGSVRLDPARPEAEFERTHVWLNEHNATFLPAEPPGPAGQPRYEVEFDVDENKRLLLTARDLSTGRVALDHVPMVKLV